MSKIICLVGPSGIGKSSYITRLKKSLNLSIPLIVTTRNKRADDSNNYQYVTELQFSNLIANDSFLEWDKFNECFYGTLQESVIDQLHSSNVILDLTPKGYVQVKQKFPSAFQIGLLPDDKLWLYKRLKERNTNTESDIFSRLQLLDLFIDEVIALNIPIVLCKYDPVSWDDTYAEIYSLIGE